MLIHRHRQYSTVGRVISWVARWLSLALIIVLLAPMLVRAELSCDRQPGTGVIPPDVARQICRDEIEGLRNRSPKAAELIAELEMDSHKHELIIISAGESRVEPKDTERAYAKGEAVIVNGMVLIGTGEGSDTLIFWNLNDTSPYRDDGVPRDPDAGAVHEFAHAVQAAKGRGLTATVPGTNVKADEIEATQQENEFRQEQGLPLRTKYDNVDVPPPVQPPVVQPSPVIIVRPPVVQTPVVQPSPVIIVRPPSQSDECTGDCLTPELGSCPFGLFSGLGSCPLGQICCFID
jgi:hypothetical protein